MTEPRSYRHYLAPHRKPITDTRTSDRAKPGDYVMTGSGSRPVIRVGG